jgi:hypothetical protein
MEIELANNTFTTYFLIIHKEHALKIVFLGQGHTHTHTHTHTQKCAKFQGLKKSYNDCQNASFHLTKKQLTSMKLFLNREHVFINLFCVVL